MGYWDEVGGAVFSGLFPLGEWCVSWLDGGLGVYNTSMLTVGRHYGWLGIGLLWGGVQRIYRSLSERLE